MPACPARGAGGHNFAPGTADGLKAITYPSGHTDTLEVAVRRAVLTGVNQTAAKLQLARAEEMGCAFVEVTAHGGARSDGSQGPADHAWWQGKVYHIGGDVWRSGVFYPDFATATGYGTGEGLCGWNCRHNFFPFWPGISKRNYTDAALEALNARDIPYQGKLYTRYEISQMQRALERRVRSAKRKYLAEDAAGLDTGAAAAKLKAARQSLAQFVQATGGRQDSARESVGGFGRSAAGKATWAARKVSRMGSAEASPNSFTLPLKSDILDASEDASEQIGVNADVNFVCELNPEIYKNAVSNITTKRVIITDKQLDHIRERHPDISGTILEQLAQIILEPDYLIETEMPSTANILKHLSINGKSYQLVLRIRTDSDPQNFENSVITFMSVSEKRYRQYLRNRRILYKRE